MRVRGVLMAGYRIVFAESQPLLRGLLEDQIAVLGHTLVGSARTGESVTELAATQLPDVALIDLDIPGLAGLEPIRDLAGRAESVAILICAHDGDPRIDPALAAGAHAYLKRPITLTPLEQGIQQAVDRCRQKHGRRSVS